jgi:hypothetical protein
MFAFRLVTISRAGRMSWPATRASLVFLGIMLLAIWILPLFPATPKLAPIFNPITHMVPPSFPVLVVFPAIGIDLVLRRTGERDQGWRRLGISMILATVFVAILLGVQWFFSEFMLSPYSRNWFFAGDRFWSFASGHGAWRSQFWHVNPGDENSNPFNFRALVISWLLAFAMSWLGLLWGGWMKKVKR